MATTPARDVREQVQQNLERNALRVRNGAKYLLGLDRPRVGQTPKDVVWTRDKVELWRYRSEGHDSRAHVRYRPPVLLIHSLISKSFILDLHPGNSFVQWLRDAGFDVFLVSWGVPDERESDHTLETYVDDYIPRLVEATRKVTGSDDVTLYGYCFGGLMSLLSVARHPEMPVRNLVTMATPVDFTEMGLFSAVMGDERLDPERLLGDDGNVPPDTLRNSFRLLKPTGDFATYVNLVDRLWDDKYMAGFQAMGQWTRDHIPFPGGVFRQMVEMTRENALVNGTARLGGEPVDLRAIKVPVLNVLACRDHIVREGSAAPLVGLVGSDQADELRLDAGHVALVAGRRAAKETIPHIAEWLKDHSDAVSGGGTLRPDAGDRAP